jgi:hypothetical protein
MPARKVHVIPIGKKLRAAFLFTGKGISHGDRLWLELAVRGPEAV